MISHSCYGLFCSLRNLRKHAQIDAFACIISCIKIALVTYWGPHGIISPPPPKVLVFLPLQLNVGERAVQRAVLAPSTLHKEMIDAI